MVKRFVWKRIFDLGNSLPSLWQAVALSDGMAYRPLERVYKYYSIYNLRRMQSDEIYVCF
ncbi:hypothetical protein RUMHYD_03126 [Blautia hydrogenotrophica DSM 10507]|uniref:Uncharacterized protein n=1 Tax=Blautia hydrogenotrophica (strain DSM 10507 / JCM 14656 / S5a33) TaxID=476272 RepID=C0CQH0_BLAHS|nr:hypothetical protein RUMHYD_03126 [Blautia hydrogenotrophica DSM 10507]